MHAHVHTHSCACFICLTTMLSARSCRQFLSDDHALCGSCRQILSDDHALCGSSRQTFLTTMLCAGLVDNFIIADIVTINVHTHVL